ncbi:unnamed protein product [Hymenolepis diminuta]|uniref:CRC domain-containing protein n=1 Tax=Hymenolepis diminuta TaxID=6216 RepID=A0A564YP77_HYMDI|nr:unnamed protein product [Hymenolepis diminuta]
MVCSCKKVKCFSNYCTCFSNKLRCSEHCICHDCINRPITEVFLTWENICEIVDLMRVRDVYEDSGNGECQRLLRDAVEEQRSRTSGIDDVEMDLSDSSNLQNTPVSSYWYDNFYEYQEFDESMDTSPMVQN